MKSESNLQNGLLISLSILIASIATVASIVFYTVIQADTTATNNKNIATQQCLELAKGIRTTTGSSDNESWKLEQVDINYDVVKKCLQEKNAQ